jgi:hypothetical protein
MSRFCRRCERDSRCCNPWIDSRPFQDEICSLATQLDSLLLQRAERDRLIFGGYRRRRNI